MLDVGTICLWYGSSASVPAGWHVCDGTVGTPDLRDRFLIGAGSTFAVDATGGALTHTHDFTGDGHDHALSPDIDIAAGGDFANVTSEDSATGTTDAKSTLPPYHSLHYIMRV